MTERVGEKMEGRLHQGEDNWLNTHECVVLLISLMIIACDVLQTEFMLFEDLLSLILRLDSFVILHTT